MSETPHVEHIADTRVQAAVNAVDRLHEAPVDQHVAVFEQAHEDLRALLADAGLADAGLADAGDDHQA